jgi:RNA polymerase sigma factor (sigma-70 family)
MELLERFAAGDLEAFETLFRQNQREVYAWVVRIVRDSGIAEDLTVETFWRIYRSRARFQPSGNFQGWARRIATNAALDHLRRNRRETQLPDPDQLSAPMHGDSAVRQDERRKIWQAFQQLPPKYRLVARLALIEDEPYDEIAAATGLSAGLVKIRVFRAVRMLRKSLTAMGITLGATR